MKLVEMEPNGSPSGGSEWCLSLSVSAVEEGCESRVMAKAPDKVGTCWNRPVSGKQRDARNNGSVF